MTLTFATVGDFQRRKRVVKSEWEAAPDDERRWIQDELRAATRHIFRYAGGRDFFPYYDTLMLPIPYTYADLSVRRLAAADIFLNNDLLECTSVINEAGDTVDSDDYFFLELNINPKYAIALKFPQFWTGSGFTVSTLGHLDQSAVTVAGIFGYHDDYNNAWIDTLEEVAVGGITASATSIVVTDAGGMDGDGLKPRFEAGQLLRIEDEFIEVLDVVGNGEITVQRGVRGSTAATHAAAETILRWRVIEDISQACYMIAKTWREADESKGGRQGVSDMSTGVELSIPGDPLKIIKSYRRPVMSNRR